MAAALHAGRRSVAEVDGDIGQDGTAGGVVLPGAGPSARCTVTVSLPSRGGEKTKV
ncbi:hypothetical protein GCM10025734_06660 [Kitasatospora paranensis]